MDHKCGSRRRSCAASIELPDTRALGLRPSSFPCGRRRLRLKCVPQNSGVSTISNLSAGRQNEMRMSMPEIDRVML